MKKILSLFFGFLCIFAANAAQVANVEYVHTLIEQEWDISIPYNSALSDIHTVANMKYLLTAIDVANEILNGEKTTDYGNGEFATLQAADTIATNQAVETLIEKEIEYEFFMDIDLSRYDDNLMGIATLTEFGFNLSAAGTFYIDWGDGTTETIKKANTYPVTYSHDYGTATGVFRVGIGGRATDYSDDTESAVLHFWTILPCCPHSDFTQAITNIDGSLGAIFGTLADGSQPSFYQTFYSASNMKGTIPANLFAGISGAPASGMFQETFSYCSGLTGAIPDGLFAGISGAPADYMFHGTFSGCSGLTSIPDGLFAGISGAPAEGMFNETFSDCSGLTSIPENLFGNISGTNNAVLMFDGMFKDCTSLTGPSARINGQYLYEIWPYYSYVYGAYYGCKGLSDYNTMPINWKDAN